ncbi:acyloxyacyl hydrolase [Sphingomonas sp. M1-B02]|uniref:acyloxyacyl hydrolase n=1 Tax=Sphingomonas sp. M1-B02 TaxID=3114300 RepID=UPI00223F1B6B|nr:acyloxyacyl hydrolase [Sphingomonas sp. S6-11]UZK65470.1 acyloxyacyl hydrolase [Sphingomonas sp. S6-11]
MKRLAWWAWLLMPGAAAAQERVETPETDRQPEIAVGVFEHGANFHPLGDRLFFPRTPPGVLVEGAEEDGTVDIQLVGRTAPIQVLLKPRLAAKLQVSTAGRTSFASVGLEWRQHAFRGRVYGQVGMGLTVIDGYSFTPDPFAPDLSRGEALRRYDIYRRRTAFGSRLMFNPNASLGLRIDRRLAIELAWEHFSHRQIFSETNPGIDNLGLRLVRTLGPRR